MNEILAKLDISTCGQIALVLFVAVFIAETLRAILMRPSESERRAQIPLSDGARR